MGVPIENIQVGNELHPISAQTLNTPASIDGVAFDGGESITHFSVCSTAAGTAAKTVSVGGEFTRDSGSEVRVKFTYANTASNPTLDVNNTGAAPISVYGDQNADSATWQAGETLDLVFDGTRWQIVGGGIASTSARGRVMLDATPTSGSNNAPSSGGVYAQLALKAPLASPALTGTPTAPTASPGDNSTQIATTAYVDAAVAVETARAEAVEATKADQSFAEYILLREEEDRQILFGSVVEAAEDTYDELRSSPIHTAITIGGSVYPRMDNTRMAIDRILGRTVAFNQLCSYGTSTITSNGVTFTPDGNGGWDFAGTPVTNRTYLGTLVMRGSHVYIIREQSVANEWAIEYGAFYRASASYDGWRIVKSNADNPDYFGVYFASTGTAVSGKVTPQCIDLTAQYGTTLTDQIYALEQATTGAGVAYVRQRLDLDYYAPNAGELVAPVVSGVGFVGFNAWDEEWEVGTLSGGSPAANANCIRSKNFCKCLPNTAYYCACLSATSSYFIAVSFYDYAENYIGGGYYANREFTTPANAAYFKISTQEASAAKYGNTYLNDICINLSSSRNGEYEPYQYTNLSLPSTRLDGVGTAQDTLYVREDGENDYSLIKRSNAYRYTFTGNESVAPYSTATSGKYSFAITVPEQPKTYGISVVGNLICDSYLPISENGAYMNQTGVFTKSGASAIGVYDPDASTTAAIKTKMTGKSVVYELATPTETVIAEHLTLAEVSAIAENGGIISVENSNGHIVQPDLTCDAVISRSAS